MKKPQEIVDRILDISLTHPGWGCNKICNTVQDEGITISAPTVQNILNREDLGTRQERWIHLESLMQDEDFTLTEEQTAFVERLNPCFRLREEQTEAPGERLNQDLVFIDTVDNIGRIYLHFVIDTFSNYVFGFVHSSKRPEAAVALLHNDVLIHYRRSGCEVQEVVTNNRKTFSGGETHGYELYMDLNGTNHRITEESYGAAERFMQIFQEEYLSKNNHETVGEYRSTFNNWLQNYNQSREHRGFPNNGETPYNRHRSVFRDFTPSPVL